MELSTLKQNRLEKCEQDIDRGIEGVQKSAKLVGMALKQIHDDKLYRGESETFEQYCESRWGFTKRRAYQLMNHVDALKRLGYTAEQTLDKTCTTAPPDAPEPNERQTRELAAAPEEQQAEVWTEAVAEAETEGTKPTAAKVSKIAKKKAAEEAWAKIDREFPLFVGKVRMGIFKRPPDDEVILVSKLATTQDRLAAIKQWQQGESALPADTGAPEAVPTAHPGEQHWRMADKALGVLQGHFANGRRELGTEAEPSPETAFRIIHQQIQRSITKCTR